MLFDPKTGAAGLEKAIQELCLSVEKAVDDGKNYIVLSDRGVDATHAPIPSLACCFGCASLFGSKTKKNANRHCC